MWPFCDCTQVIRTTWSPEKEKELRRAYSSTDYTIRRDYSMITVYYCGKCTAYH